MDKDFQSDLEDLKKTVQLAKLSIQVGSTAFLGSLISSFLNIIFNFQHSFLGEIKSKISSDNTKKQKDSSQGGGGQTWLAWVGPGLDVML